jgi:hypothetical protein
LQDKHYALIYCFEFLVIEGRHKDWQTCFDSLGLPKKPVLDCYISGNGTKVGFIFSNSDFYLFVSMITTAPLLVLDLLALEWEINDGRNVIQ